MAPSWDELLDRLEEALAEQRLAVSEHRWEDVAGLTIDGTLGPVPSRLWPRARALLAEMDAVERCVADQLEALARRTLAARRSRSRQGQPGAVFVDRSA